jgi:nitrogenase-associated protein
LPCTPKTAHSNPSNYGFQVNLDLMASIVFYEKPGCVNNGRQKLLLLDAGHDVESRNLLTQCWQADELREFFGDLPVVDWFNMSAQAVKNCEVIPSELSAEQALELMLHDPLLIRRPLMRVGEQRLAGFDIATVDRWIGLGGNTSDDDLEHCPRQHDQPCETPA